ncbi:hypothetical protein [Microcoleus sp. LEGE 07076]|nr:hypothetical protein [Microcoleus sp. LEGE 07076]
MQLTVENTENIKSEQHFGAALAVYVTAELSLCVIAQKKLAASAK